VLVEGGSGCWSPFIEGTVGTWGHSPVVATGSSSCGHHPGPASCRRPGWSSSHCGAVMAWCCVSSSCPIGCCVVGCCHLALHGRPLWSWCYWFDDDE